jgi:hypothetical protein
MHASDLRSNDPLRHGAYVCLRVPPAVRDVVRAAAVPALAARVGLRNEFDAGGYPTDAIAFLRRVDATPGALADNALTDAEAVVHVASASAGPVAEFCAEIERLLSPATKPHVLGGVVRPMLYTGNAMHNFAYAHRVLQQPGTVKPNAFLIPMSKTAEWWAKDWIERHTYFLPRYDDVGRMVSEGHALASAAGIACLMRRTYKYPTEPAPPGAYDFVTYFECADADVPTFHAVCAALRDVTRNPEWKFVREARPGTAVASRRGRSWSRERGRRGGAPRARARQRIGRPRRQPARVAIRPRGERGPSWGRPLRRLRRPCRRIRGDSMTLAISHHDRGADKVMLDVLREARPPFNPERVVEEVAEVLERYACGSWSAIDTVAIGLRRPSSGTISSTSRQIERGPRSIATSCPCSPVAPWSFWTTHG